MIYVVAHKIVDKINKNEYKYILVNSWKKSDRCEIFDYVDSEGDNISSKNYCYCELTAIYWIWKNRVKDGYVGICHYRRFFSNRFCNNEKFFISNYDINELLKKYDFIVPKKFTFKMDLYRNYFLGGEGYEKDLIILGEIIHDKYPDYYEYYVSHLNKKQGHFCNMFICNDDIFDSYCEWIFDILFTLEKKVDISSYSTSEKRIFGYLSELLLDVFIEKNGYNFIEKYLIRTDKKITIKQRVKRLFGRYL